MTDDADVWLEAPPIIPLREHSKITCAFQYNDEMVVGPFKKWRRHHPFVEQNSGLLKSKMKWKLNFTVSLDDYSNFMSTTT